MNFNEIYIPIGRLSVRCVFPTIDNGSGDNSVQSRQSEHGGSDVEVSRIPVSENCVSRLNSSPRISSGENREGKKTGIAAQKKTTGKDRTQKTIQLVYHVPVLRIKVRVLLYSFNAIADFVFVPLFSTQNLTFSCRSGG